MRRTFVSRLIHQLISRRQIVNRLKYQLSDSFNEFVTEVYIVTVNMCPVREIRELFLWRAEEVTREWKEL